MENLSLSTTVFCLYKDVDADTLHNVKYIFIFGTIWRCLFLTTVTMQVKNIDFVKCTHQLLPYLTMYNSINKTVIADIGQNTRVILLNKVLP